MKNCIFVIILFVISMFFFLKPKPDYFIEDNLINPYVSSVEILNKNFQQIGSGTILFNKKNSSMLVLSAYHVVEFEKEIFISTSYDDIKRKALVLKKEEHRDLAILKVVEPEKNNGPYAKISKKGPKVGQNIFVIGNPGEEFKTITNGIIGSILYKESIWGNRIITSSLYRITAPVFHGSSGSGLFNEDGNFIGVVIGIGEIKSYLNIEEDGDITKDINAYCLIPKSGASFAISLEEVNIFLNNI